MIWIWLGFISFVLLMLGLDLGFFHRKAHVVALREALILVAGMLVSVVVARWERYRHFRAVSSGDKSQ